jgi:protein-tyrosine-phosphatase
MAEALFRARLQQERPDWKAWRIESAGTWASDGAPATRYSFQAMAERGLNLGRHHAKTVTAEFLGCFDLILTMEAGHKEALQIEFPFVADRVYMLSEMEGKTAPVNDPFGQPYSVYQETAYRIDDMIKSGFSKIITTALENWRRSELHA